ncbi:endolytic transglycosylase MltG [Candidatus Gottesmanbacteria bacterium]|nr:endolytic transglycosylase MltG [Candidatus Gottesmanbacteria bacterium]
MLKLSSMKIVKSLSFALLILLIIGIVIIGYLIFLLSPTSLSSEKIRFVINLDTKQDEIIEKLSAQNFIRSQKMFNFLLGIMQFPGNIDAGAFVLRRNMNAYQIADTLLHHPYQKWIILVPGLRKKQVAERIAKKFNWSAAQKDEFLKNAKEGYLFPDTYLLNVDYTPLEIIQRLLNNFNEKFDAQMQKDLLTQNVKIDTAVKIASLIERESGGDEDKSLISGIIWNRLDTKMKLQIDATTQYIIGTEKDWWPIVRPSDHKIDSPFNTYINVGLPPTAIANPSLASLKAAVYPEETDCIFYLHDRAKRIHCSVTYEEHLENIDKYLK